MTPGQFGILRALKQLHGKAEVWLDRDALEPNIRISEMLRLPTTTRLLGFGYAKDPADMSYNDLRTLIEYIDIPF